MAFFKRSELESRGFTADQIDYIMTESGKFSSSHVAKDDVQAQINKAIDDYKKTLPPEKKLEDFEEYRNLLSKSAKLEAFGTDVFASVKAPYKDMVWDKLDHSEKHKDYKEQLTELQKSMPDIFVQADEGQKKPQFGADTQGRIPSGDEGSSFGKYWGFTPEKGK